MSENGTYKHARQSRHYSGKHQAGLKNLFKLISLSNVSYYYRVPRIRESIDSPARHSL